jgi:hypothetical protein
MDQTGAMFVNSCSIATIPISKRSASRALWPLHDVRSGPDGDRQVVEATHVLLPDPDLNTGPCQDKERFALHGDPLQYRSIRRIIGPVRALPLCSGGRQR